MIPMEDVPNNFEPWETPVVIGYCVFCEKDKFAGEIWKTIPDHFVFTCLGNMVTDKIRNTTVPLVMCKECKQEVDLKSERITNHWDDIQD